MHKREIGFLGAKSLTPTNERLIFEAFGTDSSKQWWLISAEWEGPKGSGGCDITAAPP